MGNPAYEYGRLLGSIRQGYVRMFEQIAAGMRGVTRDTQRTLQTDPEELARARYALRIEAERRKGLLHVKKVAEKARQDLGLDR